MAESNRDVRSHELQLLVVAAAEDLANRYNRIQRRVLEDPGTAGDQGEENWADLLRNWLPSSFTVVTKGRILGREGNASPQVDVLVLRPSYPKGLLNEKLYLAEGVAAAFECKLTLRSGHVRKAVQNAVSIRSLLAPRIGGVHRELNSPLIYGLIAHSHIWKGKGSRPVRQISQELHLADEEITKHPREMLDLICVADLNTWRAEKQCLLPTVLPNHGVTTQACVHTIYLLHGRSSSRKTSEDELREYPVLPIGIMLTTLLEKIAVEQEDLSWLADYLKSAGLRSGSGGSVRYDWPSSVISATLHKYLEEEASKPSPIPGAQRFFRV